MNENYSLRELNEWADKVIDCISKWADEMNKAFNGTPTSIKIEKLDSSEHDKVFEDKIAELENIINNKLGGWDKRGITYQEILDMKAENQELKQITKGYEDKIAELKKDYKTASELLGKYQQENESLKQRIDELEKELEEWKEEARVVKKQRDEQLKSFRKGIEPYVDLLHMHETIAELKQHIAELESKESEKTMRIEFHADNGEMLTPLEVANSLINQNTFKVDELRELSEFLQVYCNHHEDRDIDASIMLF